MNNNKLLDELHKFKKNFNLSEEEEKEINLFIDNIVQNLQEINKNLNKKNVEKLAKIIKNTMDEKDGKRDT